MKFSDVLSTYTVTALGEVVGWSLPEEGFSDYINIHFVSEGQEYDQYFRDQDVVVDPAFVGMFIVTDNDGDACEFMALKAVDLTEEPQ